MIKINVEPLIEVIKKRFVIELWFRYIEDAIAYKSEEKYKKRWFLEKEVRRDKTKTGYQYKKLYILK